MKDVYVVVWEDRHTDADISVCATREIADRVLDEWMETCDGEFVEHDHGPNHFWVRDVTDVDDDGPRGRIERHSIVEV